MKSEDCVSQGSFILILEEINEMEASIKREDEANNKKIEQVKESSGKFEELNKEIKEIKSKE